MPSISGALNCISFSNTEVQQVTNHNKSTSNLSNHSKHSVFLCFGKLHTWIKYRCQKTTTTRNRVLDNLMSHNLI